MARNRMIKPEFWTSEQVVECSTSARLLFIGMWNFADDAGNQPASFARMKMLIFPGDDFTLSAIEGYVQELTDARLLEVYTVESERFVHITGWHHQRIDRPTIVYPPHPGGDDSASTRRALDEHSIPSEAKRSEAKRSEEKRSEVKRTNVRTFTRVRDLTIKEEDVDAQANIQNAHIQSIWKCNRLGPKFQTKLWSACAAVSAGVLPEEWLTDAVCRMCDVKRRSPAGWLGTVLAATALEAGVDFDSFQRQLTTPTGET